MNEWQFLNIKKVIDVDGAICIVEGNMDIPFEVKRVFFISGADKTMTRGNHATKQTRVFLIAAKGSFDIVLDNGAAKECLHLADNSVGLLVEPMVWRQMRNFSDDCLILALCDRHFTSGGETIDDYEEFLAEKSKHF